MNRNSGGAILPEENGKREMSGEEQVPKSGGGRVERGGKRGGDRGDDSGSVDRLGKMA